MFAFTDNVLLYYTVVFLKALTSLVTNCYTVLTVDYILVVLYCVLVQVVFKALGYLTVSIKDFAVIKLTA